MRKSNFHRLSHFIMECGLLDLFAERLESFFRLVCLFRLRAGVYYLVIVFFRLVLIVGVLICLSDPEQHLAIFRIARQRLFEVFERSSVFLFFGSPPLDASTASISRRTPIIRYDSQTCVVNLPSFTSLVPISITFL